MQSIKKIKLLRYFALTILSTLVALLFNQGRNEIYGILVVYVGTIANHYLLLEAGDNVVKIASGQNVDKLSLITILVGKFAILIGAIYLGWHFMDDRVFIPMLNYLVQIFILILCFDKKAEV